MRVRPDEVPAIPPTLPGRKAPRIARAFSLLAFMLMASCQDADLLTPPAGPTPLRGASGVGVSEGAVGGVEGFHFLPPIGRILPLVAELDSGLDPVVQVCEPASCEVLHAEFTTTGAGARGVRVSGEAGHYLVHWDTGRTGALAGETYQVRVLVDGEVVGYAFVGVVANQRGGARAGPGSLTLVAGQTLPIRFRIERGEEGGGDPEPEPEPEPGCAPLDFTCEGALDGWDFTGDWRVYTGAPPSFFFPSVAFPAPALGTDGNRSDPYPGAEFEQSSATSPMLTLGDRLDFLSWHVDEGGSGFDGTDRKAIEFVPSGGGSPVVLLDCASPVAPMCLFLQEARDGDDWDAVSIDTAALSGQEGRLIFRYDTVDTCCAFEQGWYMRDFAVVQGP